VDYNFIKRKR